MLDKSAVDQMVRDAQEHAEEDKQRREEVETRNQAEALTFQAERAIKDLGDKVSSEDKVEVENKIESLRESLKGSDMDAVKTGMTSLAEVLQRVSTAASDVETKVTALREALKGNDLDAFNSAHERARRAASARRRGRLRHAWPAARPTALARSAGNRRQRRWHGRGSADAEEAVEGEFKEV